MIKPAGQAMSAAIEAAKLRDSVQTRATAQAASTAQTAATSDNSTAVVAEQATASPVTRVAAQGAPLDTDKISRIKAAIASGNYPVDADAIADKMVELDLPSRSFN
jgi:negative regulator of flagellin synthesis FlgM